MVPGYLTANSVYGAIGGRKNVPMCGDWYARNVCTYRTDPPVQLLMSVHYGHPSENSGIRIFVMKLWKAERFDPAGS